MAKGNPNDVISQQEIAELKKQLQELRSKRDENSSEELLTSISALTKTMDAMLKLFTEAAEELKVEGDEVSDMTTINQKLDKIIDQNNAIVELIENHTGERKEQKPFQHQTSPGPNFQSPPEPNFNFRQPLSFEPSEQQLDEPPRPNQQGPVAMPSIPFSTYKGPKKKGLFGRLKK